MTMTKEEIKIWLKGTGKNRKWLAEKCNVSISAVNSWLSTDRGIPSKSIIIIQNLMRNDSSPVSQVNSRPVLDGMVALAVAMKPEVAKLIDAAAATLGISSEEFIRKAAVEDALEFAQKEAAKKNAARTESVETFDTGIPEDRRHLKSRSNEENETA